MVRAPEVTVPQGIDKQRSQLCLNAKSRIHRRTAQLPNPYGRSLDSQVSADNVLPLMNCRSLQLDSPHTMAMTMPSPGAELCSSAWAGICCG
jgi:hypothetical protein